MATGLRAGQLDYFYGMCHFRLLGELDTSSYYMDSQLRFCIVLDMRQYTEITNPSLKCNMRCLTSPADLVISCVLRVLLKTGQPYRSYIRMNLLI
jgi:hypothetical protein